MHKKNRILNGVFRYILLMIVLIAVNVTLDIILAFQSGSAMKHLIGSRMLDVTNTAADMIDGDTLKSLTPKDKGTPGYNSVMDVLIYFRNNIELKYIYCIRDNGNGEFVFGLDPTPVDPGEFGSPVIYTDALYEASQGTPSFDSESYQDAWGTFYSAYSPVFASDGSVAGIIAVDFSKEWYDDQMSIQTQKVLIVNTIMFVLCGSMVLFMAHSDRKRRLMSEQLAATSDIYILMYEANLQNDTYIQIYNNSHIVNTENGSTGSNVRDLIQVLSSKYIAPSSRDRMLVFVDLSTLNERLKDVNTIINEFQSIEGKWCRARFIVSERSNSGEVLRVMYLVEDINVEKRKRDMTLEAAKMMSDQLSSVAGIYFSMHDINLAEDTFSEVKPHATQVSGFFAPPVRNAQKVMLAEAEKSIHKLSRKAMREFIDFSTLEERFKDKNTITEEFLNRENIWCRARLIISKHDKYGKIEHVLYLIESIDEEKRKRDAISEKALDLNYQISSISNIYMVVYDVDLIDDKFSIIRSENMIVNSLVGDKRENSQNVINMVMESITDESSIDDTLKFIDLSTLEARLANTNTVTLEILTKTKKWVRIRFLASRRTGFGGLSHVLWLAEDIDKEKKERDKLIDLSERAIAASQAKSSFLSNMSHEIRTPINAVLGMNEMILRECEDKNILSYSNSIMTAGTTLLGLVNDILDFSKIEAGKMEIIPVDYDLSTVVNDLVTMIQAKADDKGLSLALDISRNIPKMLRGDEVRIKQVITNLLTNAVKYTEKGCVKFSIEFERIPDEPDSIMLDISVSDTGIGIKQEDMVKLFSEFDRIEQERNRAIEGTGLGMSITKHLLEMMGTYLDVESIYGMGSKFSFKLKQAVVAWDELGDYETAYKEALENRKKYQESFKAPTAEILVVDDTSMNLMVFRNLLKQTGMKIDTASSGDEGISAALGNIYDIIFLDHMMPGKDGIQTLKEMKSLSNNPNLDTITICLTANAISGAREQYIAAGFDDYITKPIDPVKLEELLMRYLPEEKVIYSVSDKETETETVCAVPSFVYDIDEIDVEKGIANCGDEECYVMTLNTYADTIDDYISDIKGAYDAHDIQNATIKIHALKSTSRIIGAADLGELAQELENAGGAGDIQTLSEKIGGLLDRCRKLSEQLSPLRMQEEEEEDMSLPLITDDEFAEICSLMIDFADECDSIGISSAADSLKDYRLTDEQKDKIRRVRKAADDFEYELINDILS